MYKRGVAFVSSMSFLGAGACEAPRGEPRPVTTSSSAERVAPTETVRSPSNVSELSFASAERLFANSGHRWIVVQGQPTSLRWSSPDAVLGKYRTDPDTQVTVFVYVFPSTERASAAVPEIEKSRLEGARSQVVQRDELVFLVESPMGLPGHPLPPSVNATFDALVASVSRL